MTSKACGRWTVETPATDLSMGRGRKLKQLDVMQ